MSPGVREAEEKETSRIEAFSDGVFAFAITLLALDLKVPHAVDGNLALARALLADPSQNPLVMCKEPS